MHTRQVIRHLIIMSLLAVAVEAGTKKAPPQESEANSITVLKEFPSYQKMGQHWRNIVISPDTTIEALTELARRLHQETPKTAFHIFTNGNDKQFRRYMLWDMYYPSGQGPQHPYPEAWANRHMIATIQPGRRDPRLGRRDFHAQLIIMLGSGVKPPVQWGYTVDLD